MISKKKFTFITLFIFISLFSNLYCEQLIPFENIFKKIKETNIQTEGLDVGYLFMVEIDSYNNFVFLDAKACQVLVVSKEGRFLKRVGKKGQGPGEFIAPSGIALDKQGNIIIADNRMRRINKYDKEGNFLSSFIITGAHWPPNLIYIDSNENFFPVLYDVESKVTEKFGIIKTPMKILVDHMGEILLFDRVRITPSAQEDFVEELDKILGH